VRKIYHILKLLIFIKKTGKYVTLITICSKNYRYFCTWIIGIT